MSRIAVSLLVAVLAALAVASSASARTASCLPDGDGPRCHVWPARVLGVPDGDTLHTRIAGYGRRDVRVIGIQAMEMTRYSPYPRKRRGECHALAATARFERLVRLARGRARVLAQNPRTRFTHRLGRSVQLRIGGRWIDAGERLVREGYALAVPQTYETAHNARYNLAQQRARRDGRGVWDDDACGAGPVPGAQIRMWVNSDPPGDDVRAFGQEWTKIQNLSATQPLPLGRWWIRDSGTRRFRFPADAVVPPRGTVTVHTGSGPGFAWGLAGPIFQNIASGLGDGAYLFDPQGDVRASTIWPCVLDCDDPLDGTVGISVQARRSEEIRVTNVAGRAIDLYGYKLEQPGYAYLFGPSSELQPGETMEIEPGGDASEDTRLVRHWGIGHPMLRDGGGALRLTNFTGRTLACASWGAGSC
jgi:endonuclease YncB( thermonuclease family)